jgi:Na+/H+ antiporter NhaA
MKWISTIFILKGIHSLIQSNHFIRVFDSNNHKILKGKLIYVTDSSILVSTPAQVVELHASEIELIKTNRSLGHYMMLSALIFSVIGFAMRLFEIQSLSQSILDINIEKAGVSALSAAIPGALLGYAIRDAKPPHFLFVNRDYNRWRKVNQVLKIWIEQ